MTRDPTLCRSFVRQAKEALSQFPELKHEWSIDHDEDHCILDIPEECEGGFPVTVEVHPDEIMIIAGGAHTHLELEANKEELAARALGLVRDLLGPGMRVRERLAGGKPHRWAFESFQAGQWVTEESNGLFFFNYFGKRTERVFQNRILPPRESPTE